ncbi:hypothetical protein [Maridesulfovibrio sp.]|uniref:hypothetical protein n=1 Tax=Maridesulfovibrio sp. TaxID=2795000 RepID=UPI002A187DDF|nr:hypothetical protein [Maridesulfovibrio sp.]
MSISDIGGIQDPQTYTESISNYSTVPEAQQESDFVESLMISKDKDSDGILTLKESGLRKKEFAELDYDADGRISAAEISAHLDQKARMGALSVAMRQVEDFSSGGAESADENMVSFESSGLDAESFSEIDSDGDGMISKDELGAANLEDISDPGEDSASAFSDAFSEFKKSFFASEEDKKDEDLDDDGEVSAAERFLSSQQKGSSKSEEAETTESETNGKNGYSAAYRSGVRAYQQQAGNVAALDNQFRAEY